MWRASSQYCQIVRYAGSLITLFTDLVVLGMKTNGFWPPQRTAQGVGGWNLNICAKDKKNLLLLHISKGKVTVRPRRGHEGPEGEEKYMSSLSLTSALDGGGWSTPHPGRFTPGKQTRYLLYRRLGGPQGRSGQVRKISPPQGFDPRTVQPVASCYPGPLLHLSIIFKVYECNRNLTIKVTNKMLLCRLIHYS